MNAEERVLEWLKARWHGTTLKIHAKTVSREIIPDGIGCLSVEKYLRNLRKRWRDTGAGIDYPDPRANDHFYLITVYPGPAQGQCAKAESKEAPGCHQEGGSASNSRDSAESGHGCQSGTVIGGFLPGFGMTEAAEGR